MYIKLPFVRWSYPTERYSISVVQLSLGHRLTPPSWEEERTQHLSSDDAAGMESGSEGEIPIIKTMIAMLPTWCRVERTCCSLS